MSNPTKSHALLIEARVAYAARRTEATAICEQAPLAYRELTSCRETEELLEESGWTSVRVENQVYLYGHPAVRLGHALPSLEEPIYPMEKGDLRGAPEAAWESTRQLLEDLLAPAPTDSSRLVTLIPAACDKNTNLWLRALPEALLGDRYPLLHTIPSYSPLMSGPGCSGLEWAWVIGERGVSMASSYAGEVQESYLRRGCRSIVSKTATTTGLSTDEVIALADRDVVAKTRQIFARDLIERLADQAIALHSKPWTGKIRPQLTLRAAAPPTLCPEISKALPTVLQKFGIDKDFEFEVLPFSDLLCRALDSIKPTARVFSTYNERPQAVRPRT